MNAIQEACLQSVLYAHLVIGMWEAARGENRSAE
jgi:hypothetical protein